MKMPRVVIRFVTLAAFFLATLIPATIAAPTPAQAGLDACVALATDFGLSDVAKAASFVADHGQCLGDLTNPSFLAVVAAVVIIEASTGAYNNGNSCEAALGGVAGKPIAAALAALASALGLPDSVKNELTSYASEEGAKGLITFMNSTPGLNVISNNWSCACAVRYSGIAETLAKIVEDTLSCTGGILESGTDAVGNFFYSWGELVQGTGLTPGIQEEQESTVTIYPCEGGWVPGQQYQQGGPHYLSSCWCPEPSTQVSNSDGTKFACRCPSGLGYKNGQCKACPSNAIPGNDGTCTPCAAGQKASPNGKTCVAACASGSIMIGTACLQCSANTYASTAYGTSVGSCKKCSVGETSAAGSSSCFSKCKESEGWDTATSSCKPQCKPGSGWAIQGEFGSCSTCGENTYSLNGICTACPAGSVSKAGAASCTSLCSRAWDFWDAPTKTCKAKCPAGMSWSETATSGGGATSQKCTPCPQGTEYIASSNQCSSCPGAMTWGKNSAGVGQCMCPEGTNRQGANCVSNAPISTPKPNGNLDVTVPTEIETPPQPCKMGWHWSAAKKKCLPGLRMSTPTPQRSAPDPADPGIRSGGSGTSYDPNSYRTAPPSTGKP